MVKFKRKKGERFETFLRRFNSALKKSGDLFKARENQYKRDKKTKRQQKQYALHSLKRREKKDYLRKIGKLDENGR